MSTIGMESDLFGAFTKAIAAEVVRQMRQQDSRLLTVAEAAQYLGRSQRALRHLIASGKISVQREGRSVRLDREQLDHWIEKTSPRR